MRFIFGTPKIHNSNQSFNGVNVLFFNILRGKKCYSFEKHMDKNRKKFMADG